MRRQTRYLGLAGPFLHLLPVADSRNKSTLVDTGARDQFSD
jgi:hypothetical protein